MPEASEPDVPPLIEPEAEPLAEPEAPAVEESVEPLEALDDGLVVLAGGVVVALEALEEGVVAVVPAPVVLDVDEDVSGRSHPVANAAASARAAVSEMSFMSSPWCR